MISNPLRRRSFLVGAGALGMAPWLGGIMRSAQAAGTRKPFALFYRVGNGTMENSRYKISNGIMENWYWPQTRGNIAPGQLTKAFMQSRSYCALSELADYAEKTIMVRGLYPHTFPGAGHNLCVFGLTGAGYWEPNTPGRETDCRNPNAQFATADGCNTGWVGVRGESLDNLLARQLTPSTPRPLLLGLDGTTGGTISYGLPSGELHTDGMPKTATSQPFSGTLMQAYRSIFGDATVDTLTRDAMNGRRTSANDLVREQIQALKSNTKFSSLDQQRLEMHLQNVRDLENTLNCTAIEGYPGALTALDQRGAPRMERVRALAKMVALAVNCGKARSIVVCPTSSDVGADLDVYDDALAPVIDTILPDEPNEVRSTIVNTDYHRLGHHTTNANESESSGRLRENVYAPVLHQVDRYRTRMFKEFLDALSAYPEENGTLLDQGVCTLYADNMNSGHRIENLGYVSVGGAGGRLVTGQSIALGSDLDTPYTGIIPTSTQDADLADQYWSRMAGTKYTPISKWLNTIGTALGATNGQGQPLNDFNAATNGRMTGYIDGMLKA